MPERTEMGAERERQRTLDAFTASYEGALRDRLESSESGLPLAKEMGVRARQLDISMLQLVGRHLEVRRALIGERGVEQLAEMDDFLSAVLVTFESEFGDDVPSPVAAQHDRLEWLRGLSDAYLAIASGATLDDRVAEVCVQARRFLGAVDARLVFGREGDDQPEHAAGDRISTELLGSAGLLTVFAPPGRRWTDAEHTMLRQLAALISAPINDARRLAFAQRAGELGALLGGVVEPGDVVSRFNAFGAALTGADRVVLRLLGPDAAAADPADEWDAVEDGVPDDVLSTVDLVVGTGEATFLTDRPATHPMVWSVTPIDSATAKIGVLAAGFDDPQPFDEAQQSFLADVGRRMAAAFERSYAFANEQVARRDAERASARWRDLQGLAADLAKATTRRRVAQTLLRRVLASGRADGGLVAVYTTRPQVEVLAQARALRSTRWESANDLVAVLAEANESIGETGVHYVGVDDFPTDLRDRLRAEDMIAVAGLPIVARTRQVGLLVLGRTAALVDDGTEDAELLQAQLAMAGAPLQRAARYDSEHIIADTLQRSLLALAPFDPPRVRWSVFYRPGSAGLAGGDWYDLIELVEDRIAIAVGDIVGRGVEAAASMGQLRSAVRALATQIEQPADLVSAVDRYTMNTGQGRYSSLAYLVLDTRTGRLSYTIAGHPPPVLRLPDETTITLTGGCGPVLGVHCTRAAAARHVGPGTSVVVYTDGLVERRGEPIDAGIARLSASIEGLPRGCDPGDTCRVLIEDLLPIDSGGERGRDDVAIVALELTEGVSGQVRPRAASNSRFGSSSRNRDSSHGVGSPPY